MKAKPGILFLLLLIGTPFLTAQESTQNIRGIILDDVAQSPIIGASVFLDGTEPMIGTTTDVDGSFELSGIPIGKHNLIISYLGYKTKVLTNLNLISGKEMVLNIGLTEDATVLDQIEVTAENLKYRALNTMSSVSTRTFSVEESQKFAGAVNDPARMALSFAG